MGHYDKQREDKIKFDHYMKKDNYEYETWEDWEKYCVLDLNKFLDEYDNVNYPKHYNVHPSGVECIQITEHMNFCLGNAIKYIWRAGIKGGDDSIVKNVKKIEDLEKAAWYLQREIAKLTKEQDNDR